VCRVCLKNTDNWIIIGLNYFAPLCVKTGIIYLINGQLKGVKVRQSNLLGPDNYGWLSHTLKDFSNPTLVYLGY
jgi:hypothetical protein